jgi:5-methylcytosine-specific restriction endonuclease McrA
MPYMTNGKRDYKKQQAYDGKPSVVKDRAKRNAARRELEKEGRVSKGDGKDVDHKKPLSKGGSNSRSNLRAVSKSSNRSFARKKNGAMK